MNVLTKIVTDLIDFINGTLVPLVFAVAFIVFIFGIFRYFIMGATSEDKRKSGKELMIYGLVGFAVMISVWGLVNLVVGTFGFDNTSRPCLPTFKGGCSGGSPNSSSPETSDTTFGETILDDNFDFDPSTLEEEPVNEETRLDGIY